VTGPTDRTRVKRAPGKARYDEETVHAIIDAVAFCHVGVSLGGDGEVVVLPFLHAREGNVVLLHGSRSNALLRAMTATPRVCAAFTSFEGMRVARTAFESSVTYRSAVVFGSATLVDDPDEKLRALDVLTDAVLPGRTAEIRRPNDRELALTTVVALSIVEASAKVSAGPTDDEPEDKASDVWAGDVPAALAYLPPVPATDGALASGTIAVPASVRALLER
jgi:hypothetical protein